MYITHWQIYALKVHFHKYSSVSYKLRGNLVLINAGASLNALSINKTLGLFTAPVVRRVDSAIHWINYYPKDSAIGFGNTYPLDNDLSGG